MKNKSISFEDRIYALIYQVYEFSKKTNKYDKEIDCKPISECDDWLGMFHSLGRKVNVWA